MAVFVVDFYDACHFPRRSFVMFIDDKAEIILFEISFRSLPFMSIHKELQVVFLPRGPEGSDPFSRFQEEEARRRFPRQRFRRQPIELPVL